MDRWMTIGHVYGSNALEAAGTEKAFSRFVAVVPVVERRQNAEVLFRSGFATLVSVLPLCSLDFLFMMWSRGAG